MKILHVTILSLTLPLFSPVQGMELGKLATKAARYVGKWLDPEAYGNDQYNNQLYEEILSLIDSKDISTLRNTLIEDKHGDKQTLEFTLGTRCVERLNTVIKLIIAQSFEQDPNKQNYKKLQDMLRNNKFIVPDLFLSLALQSLKEQGKYTPQTKSSVVNTLLYKIDNLSPEDKVLLNNKLKEKEQALTTAQKLVAAQEIILSLPPEQRNQFITQFKPANPVSIPTVNPASSNPYPRRSKTTPQSITTNSLPVYHEPGLIIDNTDTHTKQKNNTSKSPEETSRSRSYSQKDHPSKSGSSSPVKEKDRSSNEELFAISTDNQLDSDSEVSESLSS